MYIALEYFTPIVLVALFMTALFSLCVILVLLEYGASHLARTLFKHSAQAIQANHPTRGAEFAAIPVYPASPFQSAVPADPERADLKARVLTTRPLSARLDP